MTTPRPGFFVTAPGGVIAQLSPTIVVEEIAGMIALFRDDRFRITLNAEVEEGLRLLLNARHEARTQARFQDDWAAATAEVTE